MTQTFYTPEQYVTARSIMDASTHAMAVQLTAKHDKMMTRYQMLHGVLEFGPIEIESNRVGDKIVVTATQPVRWTPARETAVKP